MTRGQKSFLGAVGRWHRQQCAKCSLAKSQFILESLLKDQCYIRPPSSEHEVGKLAVCIGTWTLHILGHPDSGNSDNRAKWTGIFWTPYSLKDFNMCCWVKVLRWLLSRVYSSVHPWSNVSCHELTSVEHCKPKHEGKKNNINHVLFSPQLLVVVVVLFFLSWFWLIYAVASPKLGYLVYRT